MNPLPDAQTAYDNLFQGVHQRVVLESLASRGYAAKTAEDAHTLLGLAVKISAVAEVPAVKRAEDVTNPYYLASEGLSRVLTTHGIADPTKAAADRDHQLAIRNVAANLAADPTMYNSVLSLKAAEARQVAEQLNIAV